MSGSSEPVNPPARSSRCDLVIQPGLNVVIEDRLPQNSFVHKHSAMRSIVIVNRRALSRLPAQHQHLDVLVLHHAMT